MNFYQLTARFPPPFVRLLARHDGKAMTNAQIASSISNGASEFWVAASVEEPSWDTFPLEDIRRITKACGVDFTSRADMNRVETYLRKNRHRPSLRYLTKDPHWADYYLPLLMKWRASMLIIPDTLPKAIQYILKNLPNEYPKHTQRG